MTNVTMSTDDLFSHRANRVSAMLSPLKGNHVPCQLNSKMVGGGKVLAAHGGGARADSDFQKWRFRTSCRDVECQYFELWRLSEGGDSAYLESACLHLYKINRSTHTSEPIVFLHAEPAANGETELSEFKRGLHLHVKGAPDPIPKSHFPLTISHIDNHIDHVLSSIENLTTVFARAVIAIESEVVARLAGARATGSASAP
jgi:hypothetical protein